MTDYYARIRGHYPSGRPWGTGLHITSTDTPSALATIWSAAVSSAWTDGTHGLNVEYATGVILDSTDVATLDGSMHLTARTAPSVLTLAGTSSDAQLPDRNAVAIALRATSIGPGNLGHMRWPAPVEGNVVSGEYQGTMTTRFGTSIRALLSAVGSDGSTVFIYNKEPTLHKPTPFTKTVIVTAQCSSKVATWAPRVKGVKPSFS